MVWAPTDAPPEARCGLYLDGGKVIFTSSGVGTSILPVRLLARSQVEILAFE
jgi:predicted MPP superfamily phosphohydrolase